MRYAIRCLALLAAGTWLAGPAQAVPTEVTVRVLANDAKFIGSGVGGAKVRIQDAATGEVLAAGLTSGGTGDTDRIMRMPRERGRSLATEGTASYTATLDLSAPRKVRVTATGPMGEEASANTVTATRWLFPGRDLTGTADWVLEMPGLMVRIPDPGPLGRASPDSPVPVRAVVQMMCGCPLTPGGLWDADGFEIRAALLKNGRVVDEQTMAYAGEPSEFEAALSPAAGGDYEIRVTAYQPATGNAGIARASLQLP